MKFSHQCTSQYAVRGWSQDSCADNKLGSLFGCRRRLCLRWTYSYLFTFNDCNFECKTSNYCLVLLVFVLSLLDGVFDMARILGKGISKYLNMNSIFNSICIFYANSDILSCFFIYSKFKNINKFFFHFGLI